MMLVPELPQPPEIVVMGCGGMAGGGVGHVTVGRANGGRESGQNEVDWECQTSPVRGYDCVWSGTGKLTPSCKRTNK